MNTMTAWAASAAAAKPSTGTGAAADLGRVTTARETTVHETQTERAARADRQADAARDARRGFADAMAQQRRGVDNGRDRDASRVRANHAHDTDAADSANAADGRDTEATSQADSETQAISSTPTDKTSDPTALQTSKAQQAQQAPQASQRSANNSAEAALAQALAALLDGTAAVPALVVEPSTASGENATALTGSDHSTDAADGSSVASDAAPIAAWLLPTLLPTVMPPAPAVALAASALWSGSGAPGDAALSTGNGASSAGSSPGLSGAVAADAAQLLSLKAQTAQDLSADSSIIRAAADTPTSTDPSAWAGLQRWSAALMDASGTALSPASARPTTDHSLTLPDRRDAWHSSLMQALGDRLQLQAVQRSEQARLHLMPPQLGRIEIDIRQQGGALQVQLSATHDEVRQQLRQIAEPLRQDLVQRHTGEVSVQVASGAQASGDGRGRDGAAAGNGQGQPGQGQPRDAQRQPGRGLSDDGRSGAGGFGDALAGQALTQSQVQV